VTLRQSPPIPQARTVVVADSDPSIKAGGSDSEDEEGAALDQRRVDQRTSDLVDRETGRKGKEQVVVRPNHAMFVAVLSRGEEQGSIPGGGALN
jgi:hypothetical protein